VAPEKNPVHESVQLVRLLSGWQIPPPASLETEIRPDDALAAAAQEILPHDCAILSHIASSQPRKEWPLTHWAEFHRLASAAGRQMVFTTARGERESALMAELKRLAPGAQILPEIADLPLFLAVLARARVFISGDTGPLHFAAGLGVPTISLFGPTSPARWGPIGAKHRILTAGTCNCEANTSVCIAPRHCLAEISPAQVAAALEQIIGARQKHAPQT
jgi:heptosyltransferase-3